MKIPKTFILDHKKETDLSNTRPFTISLEGVIAENINGFIYDTRLITRRVESYLSKFPFNQLGIRLESVGRIAVTDYGGHYDSIKLVEYKTEACLQNSLIDIYEKGGGFLNSEHRGIRYAERFLFKNNILVYLEGLDEDFIRKAAEHYKDLGFRQIDAE